MKTRIDIEEVIAIQKRLDEINKLPLESIDFYRDDELIVVPEETLKTWKFVGLNNNHFVTLELWK